MEITPIDYGRSVLSEKLIFHDGDENVFRDIVFRLYLIKFADRIILVDAGCETMPGFVMRDFIGPVKALENISVRVDDITDLIITHSHHDHIECVKYFNNAVVYIQRDEYERGKKYIPDNFKINTFENEFSVCDCVKIIRIGGHTRGSCIVEIYDGDKTHVIVGDECYSRECLIKKIPTGSSFNKEASTDFILKYGNGNYNILMCHEE